MEGMEETLTHEQAVGQLRDIAAIGLSFWEALLQWLLVWGVPTLLLLALIGWYGWGYWQRRGWKGWQGALRREVAAVLGDASLDPKEQASRLNLALKRAAIAAGFRAEVAPLSAEAWFDWLVKHTPAETVARIPGWQQSGAQLVAGLYAPLTAGFHEHALMALKEVAEGVASQGFTRTPPDAAA